MPGITVKLNDVNCGHYHQKYTDEKGQMAPFCKYCGGVEAVADECLGNKECTGFVMTSLGCGYLQTSVAAKYQLQSAVNGTTLYCRPSEADCQGARRTAVLAHICVVVLQVATGAECCDIYIGCR